MLKQLGRQTDGMMFGQTNGEQKAKEKGINVMGVELGGKEADSVSNFTSHVV